MYFRLQEADIGFVVIIDRRNDKWSSVRCVLLRLAVSKIKILNYKTINYKFINNLHCNDYNKEKLLLIYLLQALNIKNVV